MTEQFDEVAKLRALLSDLERGITSLDAGLGRVLDVEDVIARAPKRYDKPCPPHLKRQN